MNTSKKVTVAKLITILAIVPVVLVARRVGPQPGHTGAPGEPTCTSCHSGPTPTGSLSITAEGGTSYTPGARQRITIRVADAAGRAFGFQASARLSGTRTQAGTFTPGADQFVMCGNANGADERERQGASCPSGTLEYVEHANPNTTGEFTFDWTPPANAQGDILIAAAGNAANNNREESGDRIYSAQITLSPGAGGNRPTISQQGVVNAASFTSGVQPGSWASILGTNLSPSTRSWDPATEIINGQFPTSLDGVRVNVGGKPAPILYINPIVVNFQVPDDVGTGQVAVELITNSGTATTTAEVRAAAPAFFPVALGGRTYAAAVHPDGAYAGPASSPGFRPAKPGDRLLLFGNSFGPTDPAVPAGRVFSGAARLTSQPTVRIGGVNATVEFAGLSGAGLYQFNVIIPDVPNGDQPVVVELPGGITTPANVFLAIQR